MTLHDSRWGGAIIPARPLQRSRRSASLAAPAAVNTSLRVPKVLTRYYDQDGTGFCVAFSLCQALSLMNGRLYDPAWLFYRGGGTDSGVSYSVCCDILKSRGPVVVQGEHAPLVDSPSAIPSFDDRIAGYAELLNDRLDPRNTLAQARAVIASGKPFLFGFALFSGWVSTSEPGIAWIGPAHVNDAWGEPVNGHQWIVTGAHDAGEYLESPNSWGPNQPMFRMSYSTFMGVISRGNGYALVLDDEVTGTEVPLPANTEPPVPVPVPTPPPLTFTCNRCGRTFPTKKKLKRHRRLVHHKRH